MNAHELPNGNLLVPKHPKAPGVPQAGDEAQEIGPEHPEWDHWYELATREAVHGSYLQVRTIEEVETALRGVERYESWHEASPGDDPRTGRRAAADAAIARAMLEMVRRSIERTRR